MADCLVRFSSASRNAVRQAGSSRRHDLVHVRSDLRLGVYSSILSDFVGTCESGDVPHMARFNNSKPRRFAPKALKPQAPCPQTIKVSTRPCKQGFWVQGLLHGLLIKLLSLLMLAAGYFLLPHTSCLRCTHLQAGCDVHAFTHPSTALWFSSIPCCRVWCLLTSVNICRLGGWGACQSNC